VQYTRITATTVAVISSVVLVATLSGCASGAGSALSVGSAKQQTIAIEQQIAAFVPKDQVITTDVTKTSRVIFPCLGKKNESYWPGSLTMSLKPGVDSDSILTAIGSNWTNKSGWSVYRVTAADGNPSLDRKSGSGYSFTVEFDQGPALTINSLSACFSNTGLAGQTSY
jgi:hypothetical protein